MFRKNEANGPLIEKYRSSTLITEVPKYQNCRLKTYIPRIGYACEPLLGTSGGNRVPRSHSEMVISP